MVLLAVRVWRVGMMRKGCVCVSVCEHDVGIEQAEEEEKQQQRQQQQQQRREDKLSAGYMKASRGPEEGQVL